MLTKDGYDILDFKGKRVVGVPQIFHQFMQNWFLISLNRFLKDHPAYSASTLLSNPVLPGKKRKCLIPENPGGSLKIEFRPDVTLVLAKNRQSLLFFVEIDAATESVTGEQSIEEKIERYRIYRGTNLYKYWERVFGVKFQGFRLLFVVPDGGRLKQLNRLLSSSASIDFVWVAELDALKQGLEGRIWTPGGSGRLASILSKAPFP